mgnify:FL=1|jgi:hypothetical protein
MDTAYIQYGTQGGPFRTVMADGLATDDTCRPNPYVYGYGAKIPTQYRVLSRGSWRRVYVSCYGNGSSSPYVISKGEDIRVDILLDTNS